MEIGVTCRQGEIALLDGTLFKPEQALAIGLLDELGTDSDDTLDKCRKKLAQLGKNRSAARALSKELVRQRPIAELRGKFQQDVEFYVKHISSQGFQQSVDAYLKSLSSKKN